MSGRDQILDVLRKQHVELKRRYPIRRLALFGSWARGDAKEDSDVDVLVDVDPVTLNPSVHKMTACSAHELFRAPLCG